ncbi:MAG: hypothetical protein JXA42_00555 [Anaerolineales bacterium]|nr:hypothetical protein [Anaerolineales bacterium]
MGSKDQSQSQQKATNPTQSAQPAGQGAEQVPQSSPAAALQRTMAAPPPAVNPNDIRRLQRSIGNRSVQQVLRQKAIEHNPIAHVEAAIHQMAKGESAAGPELKIQRTPEVAAELRRRPAPDDRAAIYERRQRLAAAMRAVPTDQAEELFNNLMYGELSADFNRLAGPVRRQMLRILNDRIPTGGGGEGGMEGSGGGGQQETAGDQARAEGGAPGRGGRAETEEVAAPSFNPESVMADIDRQIGALNTGSFGDMAPGVQSMLSRLRAAAAEAVGGSHFQNDDMWCRYGDVRSPGSSGGGSEGGRGFRVSTVDGEQAVVVGIEITFFRETSGTTEVRVLAQRVAPETLLIMQGPRGMARRPSSQAVLQSGNLRGRLGELSGRDQETGE